jgi:hypothetical protein
MHSDSCVALSAPPLLTHWKLKPLFPFGHPLPADETPSSNLTQQAHCTLPCTTATPTHLTTWAPCTITATTQCRPIHSHTYTEDNKTLRTRRTHQTIHRTHKARLTPLGKDCSRPCTLTTYTVVAQPKHTRKRKQAAAKEHTVKAAQLLICHSFTKHRNFYRPFLPLVTVGSANRRVHLR